MNINELNEEANKIPHQQRNALINIIEHKFENDITKILNRMDSVQKMSDTKFEQLDKTNK